MKKLFITGIGTDIGKTYILTQLIKHLKTQNKTCMAIKPVISGWPNSLHLQRDTDTLRICEALQIPSSQENIEAISAFRFQAPLSPSWAMQLERKDVSIACIIKNCRSMMDDFQDVEHFFVEGAGGLMSPLTQLQTNLELIDALALPVIMVGATYLGSISHLLTALAVCTQSKVQIKGIVINQSKHHCVGLYKTVETLKQYHPNNHIVALKREQTTFSEIAELLS